VWPAWAGVFGMVFIGAASLRRAYGTHNSVLYRGDFDSGRDASRSRQFPVVPSGRTVATRRSHRVDGVSASLGVGARVVRSRHGLPVMDARIRIEDGAVPGR